MLLKKGLWPTVIFLAAELALYSVILTSHGAMLVGAEFASIILCFVFALLHLRKDAFLTPLGLFFTVLADFCLVVCNPIQRLWGMVFFLMAQSCYAVMLHWQGLHRPVLFIRIALTALVEAVTIAVLKENADALALVSMAYYGNLVMNLVCAVIRCRENKLLTVGFVLFLFCDTVIGLQTAAGAYLPISQDSSLYKILFMDFHLSWFFYLPSQVLIALHSRKKAAGNGG